MVQKSPHRKLIILRWSRKSLPEALNWSRKVPIFYGTPSFTTTFTSLSLAPTLPSHPISSTVILIIVFHLNQA